jgi:hypothetical protein
MSNLRIAMSSVWKIVLTAIHLTNLKINRHQSKRSCVRTRTSLANLNNCFEGAKTIVQDLEKRKIHNSKLLVDFLSNLKDLD